MGRVQHMAGSFVSESGGVQTAGFAPSGADAELMFIATHRPESVSGGAVFCPSLFVDALRKYRTEVELARALSTIGLASCRFQYRGTGHSDGDGPSMSWDRLLDDAAVAADALSEMLPQGAPMAFVGTRFGALVAAARASTVRGGPLVLIEPVLEADRFFREGFRADKVAGLRTDTPARARTLADVIEQLGADEVVEVLGHDLGARLFQTARERRLVDVVGTEPRPILLVQLGEADKLKVPFARTVDELRRRGFEVDVQLIREVVGWWFEGDEDLPDEQLTEVVVGWLRTHLSGARSAEAGP